MICIPSPDYANLTNSPFSTTVQIILLFVGPCLVLIMTTHSPIPKNRTDILGRILVTILGPIDSGGESFNSIVLFAVKIVRGDWSRCLWRRNEMMLHEALSAGALAIWIPIRFQAAIDKSPFGWRRLRRDIPLIEYAPYIGDHNSRRHDTSPDYHGDIILCSIPPTSRITINNLPIFPISNKLNNTISILQLAYSGFQLLWQYGPMIRDQGLVSPFIIMLGYLYMSFINLIANLVQGSYPHIMVIVPLTPADADRAAESHTPISDSSAASESTATVAENHQGEVNVISPIYSQQSVASRYLDRSDNDSSTPDPHNLIREFDEWLRIHYPQIEIIEYPFLSSVSFFLHYSISLGVILTWIGLLTGFRGGGYPSQMLPLLGVIIDPILHLILGTAQSCSQKSERLRNVFGGLGMVITMKLVAWTFNLIGCLVSAKSLHSIYEVILQSSTC